MVRALQNYMRKEAPLHFDVPEDECSDMITKWQHTWCNLCPAKKEARPLTSSAISLDMLYKQMLHDARKRPKVPLMYGEWSVVAISHCLVLYAHCG